MSSHFSSARGDVTPRMARTSAKVGTPRSSFRDSKSLKQKKSKSRPITSGRNRNVPRIAAANNNRARRPISARVRRTDMMDGSLTARSKNTGMFPGGSAKLSSSRARPTKVRRDRQDFSGGQKGPKKTNARRTRPYKPTQFQRFYIRGDIPVTISHGAKRKLAWKVDIGKLDYHHYLPLFFEGLREIEEPYIFIAFQGCIELLQRGGQKVLPVVPQLIIPLKEALNTRNPRILCKVCQILTLLCSSADLVGEALVPYYRQLLPVFNLFIAERKNLGDQIDYGQRKKENLGDLIAETLEMLEKYGGEDAFINIKYMIPTFESSCV
jgi:hypothetical protein